MARTIHDTYLEMEVFSADPMKLVGMLYRGAIVAVETARQHLSAGAIRERSRQISKATAILNELQTSLDHQRGGEISRALAALYDYMRRRLIEANTQQIDRPLKEVHGLLTTLAEAWSTAAPLPAFVNATEHEYEPVSTTY